MSSNLAAGMYFVVILAFIAILNLSAKVALKDIFGRLI
jgi:hypothetical protein